MPKLENIQITAWKYADGEDFIDFMLRDDDGNQRHCHAKQSGCCKACEKIYEFLDARLREQGYTGPKSAVTAE